MNFNPIFEAIGTNVWASLVLVLVVALAMTGLCLYAVYRDKNIVAKGEKGLAKWEFSITEPVKKGAAKK